MKMYEVKVNYMHNKDQNNYNYIAVGGRFENCTTVFKGIINSRNLEAIFMQKIRSIAVIMI